MKSLRRIAIAAFLLANNLLYAGFPAGTLIKTPSGLRKIAELKIGDSVESYNLEKIVTSPIISKKSAVEQGYVVIEIESDIFISSKQQQFYMPKESIWKAAKQLKQGDALLKNNGEHSIVKTIVTYEQPLELFDLSIKDSHNYFVSNSFVLTHNFLPPIVITLSWVFGGGEVVFAGATAGLAIAAGLVGLKLANNKDKHRIEPTIIIETPFAQTSYGGYPSPLPDPNDDKDKKKNKEQKTNQPKDESKTVDDIIKESKPLGESQKSTLFEKSGDYDTAFKDFEKMNPQNIKQYGETKVGKLNDGRTVNVRPGSSDKRPTLEVYDGIKSIKIRYGEKTI